MMGMKTECDAQTGDLRPRASCFYIRRGVAPLTLALVSSMVERSLTRIHCQVPQASGLVHHFHAYLGAVLRVVRRAAARVTTVPVRLVYHLDPTIGVNVWTLL
jgi:hypothetical protein